jgi:hypothetical protein
LFQSFGAIEVLAAGDKPNLLCLHNDIL